MSRRQFVSTMNAASAALLVGAPYARRAVARSAARTAPQVAVAAIETYDRTAIRGAMEAMFEALGGLGDTVRPGDHVGIKINLTGGHYWASSYFNLTGGMHPGETFWTHPEVLRAVGELIRDAGAGRVTIAEAVYDEESYNAWGYADVGGELGADFVDLNGTAPYGGYAVRPVGEGAFIYEDFTQNGVLSDFDCVVSLAKSKRHNGAGVTHGMKNLVGTLPLPSGLYNDGQGYRAVIHELPNFDGNTSSNLRRVILDLNHATPIRLVVNDAVKTVLGGEGPWGPPLTPVSFDTLIASKDPVAADSIATQVMGFDPFAPDMHEPFPGGLNYLALAQVAGMGVADPALLDVHQAYPTPLEDPDPKVDRPSLLAFPNPFQNRVVLELSIPFGGFATVDIFGTDGRRVRRVLSGSVPAGTSRLEWDARGYDGRAVPAGMYVIRLTSGGRSVFRKLARV
jgi:uncharacterized protein (DUF362 family)